MAKTSIKAESRWRHWRQVGIVSRRERFSNYIKERLTIYIKVGDNADAWTEPKTLLLNMKGNKEDLKNYTLILFSRTYINSSRRSSLTACPELYMNNSHANMPVSEESITREITFRLNPATRTQPRMQYYACSSVYGFRKIIRQCGDHSSTWSLKKPRNPLRFH